MVDVICCHRSVPAVHMKDLSSALLVVGRMASSIGGDERAPTIHGMTIWGQMLLQLSYKVALKCKATLGWDSSFIVASR